jgi:hypothetical protein
VAKIGAVVRFHNSEGTTYAFLDKVLNKFGCQVEVPIDKGMKFWGEFQELCENALVDHHIISQNHFEVTRLTKKMTWTMKWR